MRRSKTTLGVLLAVIAISIGGGALAVYGTSNGPWGYSDSAAYISVARNVLSGAGLGTYTPPHEFRFLSHYPPFYPLLLAGVGWPGIDPIVAARWLNVLSFVATIVGVGLILARHSSWPLIAVPASLLMAIFPPAGLMFTSSMSEPLFVLLFIWGGFFLLEALARDSLCWLVLSALVIGLLPATRYIGIFALASSIATVVFFTPGRWNVRLGRAILFAALASLPIITWIAWVYFGADRSLAGRGIGVDLPNLAILFREFRASFLDTIWLWFPFTKYPAVLPYWSRYLLLGTGVAIIIGLVVWVEIHRRRSGLRLEDGSFRVFTFFCLSAVLYVVFLVLTYLFSTPTPDLNGRMLLPLFPAILIALLAAFAHWTGMAVPKNSLWRAGILMTFALLVAAHYIPRTLDHLARVHQGVGTTAYRWKDSETMQAVRDLPQDMLIVSNQAATILAWTNRSGYELMEKLEPRFLEGSAPYGSDPGDVAQKAFCTYGAALVIFDGFPGQLEQAFEEMAPGRADTLLSGLVVHDRFQDGAIYFCPK